MKNTVLKKTDRARFLERLLEGRKVFAPVREGDHLVFSEIESADEVVWDGRNTKRSPKEVFFPHSETLFRFSGDRVLEEETEEEDQILWGVRPCDARSFDLLSLVFDRAEFRDPYFADRRDRTTVVSMACDRPDSTCFCTSVGGGPADEAGSDVLGFDLGDRILLRVVTEKGAALLERVEGLLVETEEEDLRARDRVVEEAIARMRSDVPVEGVKAKLDGIFDHPVWEEISKKCLGCGACTYLCPTCHCFDITDEAMDVEGQRMRTWDSCMFPLFTLHASGHNPRTSGKERLRQRMMHKFSYTVDNWGATFCVGCGRCVRSCPVNLDIRQVIRRVQEAGK
ncbi:MAG: 4Fe-4S dicluster domain-containing protein [Candidatus Latescibacteria bacterium]|nr:4Fe-4S dicluster domain-containing protein [Candidatus Latescibacterota bacterium]